MGDVVTRVGRPTSWTVERLGWKKVRRSSRAWTSAVDQKSCQLSSPLSSHVYAVDCRSQTRRGGEAGNKKERKEEDFQPNSSAIHARPPMLGFLAARPQRPTRRERQLTDSVHLERSKRRQSRDDKIDGGVRVWYVNTDCYELGLAGV